MMGQALRVDANHLCSVVFTGGLSRPLFCWYIWCKSQTSRAWGLLCTGCSPRFASGNRGMVHVEKDVCKLNGRVE